MLLPGEKTNESWRKMHYLNEIRPGQSVRITSVSASDGIRRRLFDLGMIPGTVVECVGSSPAGDPSAYLIRGAVIALRKKDCGGIAVKPL